MLMQEKAKSKSDKKSEGGKRKYRAVNSKAKGKSKGKSKGGKPAIDVSADEGTSEADGENEEGSQSEDDAPSKATRDKGNGPSASVPQEERRSSRVKKPTNFEEYSVSTKGWPGQQVDQNKTDAITRDIATQPQDKGQKKKKKSPLESPIATSASEVKLSGDNDGKEISTRLTARFRRQPSSANESKDDSAVSVVSAASAVDRSVDTVPTELSEREEILRITHGKKVKKGFAIVPIDEVRQSEVSIETQVPMGEDSVGWRGRGRRASNGSTSGVEVVADIKTDANVEHLKKSSKFRIDDGEMNDDGCFNNSANVDVQSGGQRTRRASTIVATSLRPPHARAQEKKRRGGGARELDPYPNRHTDPPKFDDTELSSNGDSGSEYGLTSPKRGRQQKHSIAKFGHDSSQPPENIGRRRNSKASEPTADSMPDRSSVGAGDEGEGEGEAVHTNGRTKRAKGGSVAKTNAVTMTADKKAHVTQLCRVPSEGPGKCEGSVGKRRSNAHPKIIKSVDGEGSRDTAELANRRRSARSMGESAPTVAAITESIPLVDADVLTKPEYFGKYKRGRRETVALLEGMASCIGEQTKKRSASLESGGTFLPAANEGRTDAGYADALEQASSLKPSNGSNPSSRAKKSQKFEGAPVDATAVDAPGAPTAEENPIPKKRGGGRPSNVSKRLNADILSNGEGSSAAPAPAPAPSHAPARRGKGEKASKGVAGSRSPAVDAADAQPVKTWSLIELLQGRTSACEQGRKLVCGAGTELRCSVLTLVTLGFYYSAHPRRVELEGKWRGEETKGGKVLRSALRWVDGLGLNKEDGHLFLNNIVRFILACWAECTR